MSGHTPGPWIAVGTWVEPDDASIDDDICRCNPLTWGDEVAQMSYDQMRANAVLIAAAPELLAACELMDAYLYAIAPDGNERQIVQLAIAKAKGMDA